MTSRLHLIGLFLLVALNLVEAIDSARNTDVAKRQKSDIESESFQASTLT
jgi:hypothetical protein